MRLGARWHAVALIVATGLCAALANEHASGRAATDPDGSPGPRIERSHLAPGQFLVAASSLHDPNFARAVVLLVDYGDSGALGLVINRPARVALASALPGLAELEGRDDRLYVGGPVAADRMVVLIRTDDVPEHSGLVFANVYMTSHIETLRAVLAQENPAFRAYAGYAGWAPGQLDAEVLRGDWHVAPGDAHTVFASDAGSVWPELIERSAGRWVLDGAPIGALHAFSSGGARPARVLPPPYPG